MNEQLNREIARFRRPFLAALLMLILMLIAGPASAGTGIESWGWSPAADMNIARSGHTATLLLDGRVLIVGGADTKSVELYDPATNSWALADDMHEIRENHTATRLQDGRVLVTGGRFYDPDTYSYVDLKNSELFDPITGTWALPAEMNQVRSGHTATLLQDGRVLVAGGGAAQEGAELYDPSTGQWSDTTSMNKARGNHTATLLKDGRVLVAGGSEMEVGCEDCGPWPGNSTEIYDPVTEIWTLAEPMGYARDSHTETRLNDGRVLVVGGWPGEEDLVFLKSAEIYNPLTGIWTATDDLQEIRIGHSATMLNDGKVLVAGSSRIWGPINTEYYYPALDSWATAASMSENRSGHSATLLKDGRVLVAGGGSFVTAMSAEIFGPACMELPGNIVRNPCFEEGKSPWSFYSNGWAGFNVAEPGYGGVFAAKVEINKEGSNVQLYQSELPLEPNQQYRLFFAAKSNSGHDVSLYLHKHGYPYTNYGLYNEVVNLTPEWQQFTIDFSTNSEAAADGRLRFWLAPYDAAGDEYWFDNVYLVKITDGVPPPPDPNPQEPEVPPEGHCSPPVNGNVIGNPGFEAGTISPWSFYTNGSAGRQLSSDRYECKKAFEASIYKAGSNVQLYQAGIALQPNTAYKLRLAAKSTDGRDVRLYLHKHYSPYTNYGLNGLTIDLTDEWQVFVVQFTTTGFTSPVWDGRLRIWLAETDAPGAHYFFDDVVLTPLENNFSTITLTAEKSEGLQSALSLSKISVTPGMATGQLLSSGFFIDDDDAGRANGAFIPSTVRGAPRCDQARPSHAKLWPANGDMVKVKIVGAGKPTDLAVTGIWQDEAVRTEADGVIDRDQVLLRAERDGRNNGRVYHVAFTATYRGGDICRHEILVAVPPDKDMAAVDDGPLADATKP